jgi:hypothetical protein
MSSPDARADTLSKFLVGSGLMSLRRHGFKHGWMACSRAGCKIESSTFWTVRSVSKVFGRAQ